MAARPTEQEIRQGEQDVARLEGQLAAELSRLEEEARSLGGRLNQVKAAASQAQQAGSPEPALVELHRRLSGAAVPRGAFSGPREQALAARAEAVDRRKRAAEQLRQAIQDHDAKFSQLAAQLSSDEATLEGLQRRAAEDARRRGEEARQAEEAQRRAAARAPANTEVSPPATLPDARTAAEGRTLLSTRGAPDPRRSRVRMQATIDFHSESNFFQGFSTNLSEGGLFVATVHMVARGTPVDLHFTLPGGRKLDVKGVVRWTREVNDRTPDIFPGVGVQFVDIHPEVAAAIKQFVTEREPLFFAD